MSGFWREVRVGNPYKLEFARYLQDFCHEFFTQVVAFLKHPINEGLN